jgi:hypothetical protein
MFLAPLIEDSGERPSDGGARQTHGPAAAARSRGRPATIGTAAPPEDLRPSHVHTWRPRFARPPRPCSAASRAIATARTASCDPAAPRKPRRFKKRRRLRAGDSIFPASCRGSAAAGALRATGLLPAVPPWRDGPATSSPPARPRGSRPAALEAVGGPAGASCPGLRVRSGGVRAAAALRRRTPQMHRRPGQAARGSGRGPGARVPGVVAAGSSK